MKRKSCFWLLALALAAAVCLPVGAAGEDTGVVTPYAEEKSTDEFWNGATFVLERTDDTEGWLTRELERMKSQYHINTITVYGLESFDDAGSSRYKDHLFGELARLEMKIVVRIEAYDARSFAFTAEDAAKVVEQHRALIDYVSAPQRQGQVAYFALNMPVDDGTVQANLGGVNSQKSKQNQAAYAAELVRLMRQAAAGGGFADAKMFLSLFYGWDNTYEIPSYAGAGADGYFINNYSYPKGGRVPTAQDDDATLINAERLRVSMDTFVRQYGDKPIVVECGFHTLEYNGGERPNQTAGLVQDLAAKRRAVRAMAEFYGANYPQVRGILYFGYNLYKEEGTPPTVLDWALQYPSRELVQAEDAGRSGQAEVIEDAMAEGGMAVRLSGAQSGLSFSKCLAAQQLALRYKAEQPVLVGLYVGGKLKRTAELPASADYTERGILISVVEGYDLDLRLEGEGSLEIDWVRMLEAMEAEYAELCGTARAQSGENARNGAYVTGISGPENAVQYRGSRGGEVLSVTYRSSGGAKLVMLVDQEKYSVELPAAQQFTALPISAALAAGADFSLYTENGEIELDAVQLSGAPLPAAAGQQKPEAPAGQPAEEQSSPPWGWIGAGAAAALALAAGAMLTKRKREGEKQ